MAEYRLAKVAKEINRSATAIADFLNSKGFSVDARPTTKITEDMYQACLKEFSADRAAKEEADKLKANQPARPIPTREKVETVDTISAPETIAVSAPEPVVEVPVEKAKVVETRVIENTPDTVEVPVTEVVEEQPISGIKVVGKIDLTPKTKKKVEEVKEETPAPIEVVTPIEPIAAVEPKAIEVIEEISVPDKMDIKEEAVVLEEDKAPLIDEPASDEPERHETRREVLSGPKVLGKIQLPVEKSGNSSLAQEARKDMQEIRKKRKRKEKGVEVKVAVQETVQREHQHNKTHKPVTAPKPEVTTSQVNTNVRSTFNRMGSKKNGRDRKRTDNKEERNRRFEAERRRKDEESKVLKVTEFLTANELATMMSVPVTQVISKCFALGMMVSINQRLDAETIQLVADDFNFEVQFVDAESQVEAVDEEIDNPADLKPRAPIVTVMGHVDHGKTSLLDYIRQENVIAGEAGGITQHIGAYEVTLKDGKKITFLDTPGHEAFTAMRARGAKVTDMAIIVIAADDSVMPQTREAIAHAQAAGVPMIFAFNKIDKDGANADKIREQLASMNILVEDWGGKFQAQEISAKKGLNIDVLLEKVLLEAEMMQLTANPDRRAKGTVIEATQEKGRGIVCTLLIQTGTLRVGDHMVAGAQYAKVRALFNERGQRIEEAPPSTPVKILGFSDAPTSGDIFAIMANEDEAKTLANKRQQLVREQGIRTKRHITLDEIGRRLAIGNFKELKVIVKADVDGSSEALTDALMKLTSDEIAVNVIHSGVGQITESDVLLASASDAIIVGFQVRPSAKARLIAENEQIDIRTYSIIYQAIEEIKSAMEGMLSPEIVEKVIGHVEIREVFKITKVGTIAGSYVTDGKVERGSKIRVIRNGVVKHEGSLASLKRFKDDVKEVTKGYECGLQISNFNDIEEGDYLEVFVEEEVKRKL